MQTQDKKMLDWALGRLLYRDHLLNLYLVREPPDVMSSSEGKRGHGIADVQCP